MQRRFFEINAVGIFLIATSCSAGSGFPDNPVEYFGSVTPAAVHTAANLDEYGVFMPTGIAAYDGRFYVQTPGKEIIREIDIANGVAVTRFVAGKGPRELLAPSYLTSSGDRAMLMDCNRMIIAGIEMSRSEYEAVFTEIPKGYGPCMSVIGTGDYLVLTGLLKDGRYMYYNCLDGDIRFFGEYRLPEKFGDLKNPERSQVYVNTKLALKPDRSRFAAINFNGGVIDINEIRDGSIIHVKGLDFHYPEVAVKKGKIGQSMDNRNGFIDIVASDDCIYVIYSGKTYRDHGPDFAFCDWLMSFDWDGNPVACHELPVPFNVICYDTAREELYGVNTGEATVLYRVELPPTGG